MQIDVSRMIRVTHDMTVGRTAIHCGAGRMEKYILRKAFDTPEDPYLPASVLWRQKEQFSDGVGYSWIDGLKEHANQVVSDQQMAAAPHRSARGWLLHIHQQDGVVAFCIKMGGFAQLQLRVCILGAKIHDFYLNVAGVVLPHKLVHGVALSNAACT